MTDTQTTQNRHPGRWPKGTSGNPRGSESRAAKEARVDAIVAEWTRPYGGASNLPPCNVVLLKHAADLSLRRPRRADDQVRLANTVSRLVAQAGLASCREQPLEPVEVEREREYVPGEASAEIMRQVAEAMAKGDRDDRCGWHIPSNLSQAELASTEPSEQTLRRMRAARDKFEAEARQQAQQRPELPPNFKVDPITGRFVIK